jgi:uncharacterized protein (TIGR02300 family)
MAAKDLGNKFNCFKCGTKFYDLKKPEPICPKCGTDQRESPALRPAAESRLGRVSAAPKAVEPVEPEETETSLEESDDLEDLEGDDEGVAGGDDED